VAVVFIWMFLIDKASGTNFRCREERTFPINHVSAKMEDPSGQKSLLENPAPLVKWCAVNAHAKVTQIVSADVDPLQVLVEPRLGSSNFTESQCPG